MDRTGTATLSIMLFILAFIPGVLSASEENEAKRLCKNQIRGTYGITEFRDVWTEQVGNHKFKVHGKVKVDHAKYPFDCKVKRGHIKSYAYNGPNPRYREHKGDDDSHLGTALAVGAGLAIVAALAASADNDKHDDKTSQLHVQKTVLEDECHDALQYRIRDEHNYTARVVMKDSRVEGHKLIGEAKVKYDSGHPHHANYTCHFDNRGRLMDSQYHLY